MHLDDPQFPPLLKGHAVRAPRKPYAEACRLAQVRELGAGDVVWGRSTARAELAVVLEPEVALERALQMGPLLMVALGDCLGSLCPPKVAVQYRWPRGILLNGATAGEVRIAAPHVPLAEIPAWLVVGATLDIAAPREERQEWSKTSLSEEAGPDITRTDILQSLAPHFLTWLNTWQEEGFRPVHDQWLFRAEGRTAPSSVTHGDEHVEGQVLGLDEGANLLLATHGCKVRTLSFRDSVDLIEPGAP
jgi:BirA family biotin operon repressor/biotin-[acetyl-CoA-carboxylase] ligase